MKLFLLLIFTTSLRAATLLWDANPESEGVGSYNVWLQTTNGTTLLANVSGTNYTSTNFTTRSKVGVSAVSTNGFESEISWGDNPQKPVRIRLTLQSSADPSGPWTEMTNMVATVDATESEKFFRDRLEITR